MEIEAKGQTVGQVYLLHFDISPSAVIPSQRPDAATGTFHARHYLGFAEDAARRIEEHRNGTGARLMQVLKGKGLSFQTARIWDQVDRGFERRLKNQGGLSRHCPLCREQGIDRDTVRKQKQEVQVAPETPTAGPDFVELAAVRKRPTEQFIRYLEVPGSSPVFGTNGELHWQLAEANGLPSSGHGFDQLVRGTAEVNSGDKTITVRGYNGTHPSSSVLETFEHRFTGYEIKELALAMNAALEPKAAGASQWLYHVTYSGHLDGISNRGLTPNAEAGITGQGSRKGGRVFVTENPEAWIPFALNWASDRSDRIAEDNLIPVVLRFPRKDVEGIAPDEHGGSRDFSATYVSSDHMQLWDGKQWSNNLSIDPMDYVDDTGSLRWPEPLHEPKLGANSKQAANDTIMVAGHPLVRVHTCSECDTWELFDKEVNEGGEKLGEVSLYHYTKDFPFPSINTINVDKARGQGLGRQIVVALAHFYGGLTSDPQRNTNPNAKKMWRAIPGVEEVVAPEHFQHGDIPKEQRLPGTDDEFYHKAKMFILKGAAGSPKLGRASDHLPDFDVLVKRHGGISGFIQWIGAQDSDWIAPGDEAETPEETEELIQRQAYATLEENYYHFLDIHDRWTWPLTVYRMVALNSPEELRTQSVGVYWTWEERTAEAHWAQGGQHWLLTAQIQENDVDWDGTLLANVHPNTGYEEQEIKLKVGAQIKLLSMESKPRHGDKTAPETRELNLMVTAATERYLWMTYPGRPIQVKRDKGGKNDHHFLWSKEIGWSDVYDEDALVRGFTTVDRRNKTLTFACYGSSTSVGDVENLFTPNDVVTLFKRKFPGYSQKEYRATNIDDLLRHRYGASGPFPGSKVPGVVYHGTDQPFSRVDMSKGAQNVFWATSDRSKVERGDSGATSSQHIMEMYVNLQNPAGWEQYEKFSIGELKRDGYDGVILTDPDGGFDVIVFKANQVRIVKTSAKKKKKKYLLNPLFHREYEKFQDKLDAGREALKQKKKLAAKPRAEDFSWMTPQQQTLAQTSVPASSLGGQLYHGTTHRFVKSIQERGFVAGSYFTTQFYVAARESHGTVYKDVTGVEGKGGVPAVIVLDTNKIQSTFHPDPEYIDEEVKTIADVQAWISEGPVPPQAIKDVQFPGTDGKPTLQQVEPKTAVQKTWYRGSDESMSKNGTAADVIRYEREELGNEMNVSDEVMALLDQYPADAVTWACASPVDAARYTEDDGTHPEQVYEVSFSDPQVIVGTDDPSEGYLILERAYPKTAAAPKKQRRYTISQIKNSLGVPLGKSQECSFLLDDGTQIDVGFDHASFVKRIVGVPAAHGDDGSAVEYFCEKYHAIRCSKNIFFQLFDKPTPQQVNAIGTLAGQDKISWDIGEESGYGTFFEFLQKVQGTYGKI